MDLISCEHGNRHRFLAVTAARWVFSTTATSPICISPTWRTCFLPLRAVDFSRNDVRG